MPNSWIPSGDIRRLHHLSSHPTDKGGDDGGGGRHVMEVQVKILLCLLFCSARKSSLDDENWKSFITESNKKKLKIPEPIIFSHFLVLKRRKLAGTLGRKQRISRWLYCSVTQTEPRQVRHQMGRSHFKKSILHNT